MALPDSFLQELVSRNNIEDVISSYVRLKKQGRGAAGLCPFHGEKTPSFVVYTDTNSFFCFGCSAGGDVITFIMRIENLSYIDAVKFLAARVGLEVPESNRINDVVSKLRSRVLEANRSAARYFHRMLYSPIGATALEYFHRRGYSDSTIKKFGMGYAPDGWTGLTDTLRGEGFNDDEMTAAFLSGRSRKNTERLFDIFRNRVMIPIIDTRGNVVAFGGRVLDDSKPKYINTSDTLAYKKTNNLFALNFAKASKAGKLILCEGYMDVIALHQAGFDNAVASLGTAFTKEHARLISQYAEEVVLVFDADEAGRKGSQNAIDILRVTGVRIQVISIPDGKDPDDFIKTYGPERFKLLMEQAPNDVEYRLLNLGLHFMLDTPDGKRNYLQKAAQQLAHLSSPIERDVYAGRLAAQLDVNKTAILSEVKYIAERNAKKQIKSPLANELRRAGQATGKANTDAEKHPRAAQAEELLIGMMILDPSLILRVADKLPPENMITKFNSTLYACIVERRRQELSVELPMLMTDYDTDGMAYVSRIVQNARILVPTVEQAEEYISVILDERQKLSHGDINSMSDDEVRDMMAAMKREKS